MNGRRSLFMNQNMRKLALFGAAMSFVCFATAQEEPSTTESQEISMSSPRETPTPGDCSGQVPDPNYRVRSDDYDHDVYTTGDGCQPQSPPCSKNPSCSKKESSSCSKKESSCSKNDNKGCKRQGAAKQAQQ